MGNKFFLKNNSPLPLCTHEIFARVRRTLRRELELDKYIFFGQRTFWLPKTSFAMLFHPFLPSFINAHFESVALETLCGVNVDETPSIVKHKQTLCFLKVFFVFVEKESVCKTDDGIISNAANI